MGQHRRCPSLYLKQESHGTRQNVTYGGLEHVGGRDRLLVLSYIPCGRNNHRIPEEFTTPTTHQLRAQARLLPSLMSEVLQFRAGRQEDATDASWRVLSFHPMVCKGRRNTC